MHAWILDGKVINIGNWEPIIRNIMVWKKIESISFKDKVATIKTISPHEYVSGDELTFYNLIPGILNGKYKSEVIDEKTITYSIDININIDETNISELSAIVFSYKEIVVNKIPGGAVEGDFDLIKLSDGNYALPSDYASLRKDKYWSIPDQLDAIIKGGEHFDALKKAHQDIKNQIPKNIIDVNAETNPSSHTEEKNV